MERYRVQFNNEVKGPYTKEELLILIKEGYLPAFVKCRKEGGSTWHIVSDIFDIDFNDQTHTVDFDLVEKIRNDNLESTRNENTDPFRLRRKKDEIREKQKAAESEEGMDLDKTYMTKETYNLLKEHQKAAEKNLSKTFSKEELEDISEKTEFYNLKEFKGAIQEAKRTELETVKSKDVDFQAENFKEDLPEEEPKKNKFKLVPIIIVLFVLVFFFDGEKGEKKEQSNKQKISFFVPKVADQQNENKQKVLFEEIAGLKNYKVSDLLTKADKLHEILRNGESEEALVELGKTYSLLLPFTEDTVRNSNIIYNIFKIVGERDDFKNVKYIEAKSRFYLAIQKYSAARFLIENYLRVNKSVTSLLMATYFTALFQSGDIDKSKDVLDLLINREEKSVYTYDAILLYLDADNQYKRMGHFIDEAYKKFPDSNQVRFHAIKYFMLIKDFNNAQSLLEKVKEDNFEGNSKYEARYYESLGVLYALKQNYDDAKTAFMKALELDSNSQIIYKLAGLKVDSNYSEIAKLVNKSNALAAMRKAEGYYQKRNWELALTKAIDAVDFAPDYLPAQLLLAKIQCSQGYYERAIENLDKLKESYPTNIEINTALLRAYTGAYQFTKAGSLIAVTNQLETSEDEDYTNAVAEFYLKKEDVLRGSLWYLKSLEVNPLSDHANYMLAKIYLDNSKFDKSKEHLNKAIELDPSNLDYRILYSDLLYELKGTETAIGYLRSLKETFFDISRIDNKIAINYYKSGQIKSFEELLIQMKELNLEGADLYYFLMKAAQSEGKYSEVVKKAKQYLFINPADNEVRITLAKTYFDLMKYDQVDEVLGDLQVRSSNYPQLNSLMSKLRMLQGKKDEAMSFANSEIQKNPSLPYGYIQLADLYIQSEDYTQAEDNLKRAQRISPSDVNMLKKLAFVKFKTNQMETALDLYKKVLDRDQGDVESYFYQGEVYRYLGRTNLALDSYKIYLDLYPESPLKDKVESYINSMK